MDQENKDLAKLIEKLAEKTTMLAGDSGDSAMEEIRSILSSMEGNVEKISATLSAIAEEE